MADIIKHGVSWPGMGNSPDDQLKIEMACIQRGGQWVNKFNQTCGLGKYEHFQNMRKLIWPDMDAHRWQQLCTREMLSTKVCTLLGVGGSGKTHSAAALFLLDYWCFPDNTVLLISSTDLRGLDLRVWGEIKKLHERGQSRFPWLAGHINDTKRACSTDDLEEDDMRDLRKGIIAIPCVVSGKYVGLSKYIGIHQERVRLIGDECFPAGSLVSTPLGPVPIENIKTGDVVLTAAGMNRVKRTGKRFATKLVRLTTADGRQIVCTPEHPFFTLFGWKKAIDLFSGQYMVSGYEAMQILRGTNGQFGFLQQILSREMDDYHATRQGEVLHQSAGQKDFQGQIQNAQRSARIGGTIAPETVEKQLHEMFSYTQESERDIEINEVEAEIPWWERNRSDKGGGCAVGHILWLRKQFSSPDKTKTRFRLSESFQDRRGVARIQTGRRSGWDFSQFHQTPGTGCEKDQSAYGSRLDRCEILESSSIDGYSKRQGGVEVYNLEVADHPSYCVNGLLVHNCQFMAGSFLSAFANLNQNPDFWAAVLGNPQDPTDPLGRAAEPKDGWNSYMAVEKTTCWDTKFFNGRCVNLVGPDSPNFDYDQSKPPKFPYLPNRRAMQEVIQSFGADSDEVHQQCVGNMRTGMLLRRVVTRDLCRQFKAQEDVVWRGRTLTRVYFVDAAYGGDRCVGGYCEFGEDIEGKQIFNIHKPKIIPIRVGKGMAEDQIAIYVKEDCDAGGIPPENMGHDATGRGSLGTALARVWSAQTNPIEFGGVPTDRPVSLDHFIRDPHTKQQRLILCSEHYAWFVTELWYSVRYCIEAGQMRNLPEDVMEELCMREWKRVGGNRIQVEPKSGTADRPGMKQRTGRSPDLGDWLAGCLEMARRKGFNISKLANKDDPSTSKEWFYEMAQKQQEVRSRHQLNYTA